MNGKETVWYWLVRYFPGGAFPFTVGRIEHGYNVRPDLCATNCKTSPRNFLGKFYTDALVHDPRALDLLVDVIGEVSFANATPFYEINQTPLF